MKYLVTGASGFTGRALVKKLCDAGLEVRGADIFQSHHLDGRAEFVKCDVTSDDEVAAAVKGVHCVMHLGAIVPFNLPSVVSERVLMEVNVKGTERLVHAAKRAGASRFVLASSTGVVFCGTRDISGEAEDCPLPSQYNDAYSRSKGLAEELVLREAGRRFGVVALRPNGIWGPGEAHHTPKLLAVAVAGLSGTGFGITGDTDFTHVDNLTAAFVAADAALQDTSRRSSINGKAYFITDERPVSTIEFFTPLLRGLGYAAPYWLQWMNSKAQVAPLATLLQPEKWDSLNLATSQPTLRVPDEIMFPLASAMENGAKLLRATTGVNVEPFFTSADMRKLTFDNYYVCSAARRDLNWAPLRSMESNMLTLISHYRSLGYDGTVYSPGILVYAVTLSMLLLTFALAWNWWGFTTAAASALTMLAASDHTFAASAGQLMGMHTQLFPLSISLPAAGTHAVSLMHLLQAVSWGAVIAHVGEGLLAAVLAARNRKHAAGWWAQTTLLGFSSLQLLLASCAATTAVMQKGTPMLAPDTPQDGKVDSSPLRTGVQGLDEPGEASGVPGAELPHVELAKDGKLPIGPVRSAEESTAFQRALRDGMAAYWWVPPLAVTAFAIAMAAALALLTPAIELR